MGRPDIGSGDAPLLHVRSSRVKTPAKEKNTHRIVWVFLIGFSNTKSTHQNISLGTSTPSIFESYFLGEYGLGVGPDHF
jgi:hypothetical protein